MQEGSWDGIRAKLERAQVHLDVLDNLIGAYFEGHPYRIVGEEDRRDGYWHFAVYLEVTTYPPDEIWGPIIGDAVHNLRSALDHVAWRLALDAVKAETPRRIDYPIFFDNPADDKEVARLFAKKLDCLRPEAHAVIEGTQPYKTRNLHHPLWLLQSLWNTDKHRTLHTAGFAIGGDISADAPFGYSSWTHGPFNTEGRTPLVRGYTSLRALASDTPLQDRMDTYEDVTFDVSMGHSGPLDWRSEPYGGLPIRQVLRHLQGYIDTDVVEPLKPLL